MDTRNKTYNVRLTYENPAWDEVDGIVYPGIVAAGKREAIKLVRRRASDDGHTIGRGRYWFRAEEVDSPQRQKRKTYNVLVTYEHPGRSLANGIEYCYVTAFDKEEAIRVVLGQAREDGYIDGRGPYELTAREVEPAS
ncbi:MAG TPA: hypothetical protein VFQ88_02945 [Nevskiaceae bacterium]|nr:hypothetical protein [Nevskiaceae bacterium]